jgi:hypothetical protein
VQRRSGSRPWEVMQEKEAYVRLLLGRGLTVRQISGQLRCSESFVRAGAEGAGGAGGVRSPFGPLTVCAPVWF